MVQRSLTFIALTSILACSGDPTGDFRNGPDHLTATPTAVYVGNGTIQSVVVASVDEAGNQVEDNFELGTVGAGITVVRDSTFDLVTNDAGELVVNPHPTRVRYNVTTTTFQATEFTVNAGSRSVTIPVRTEPVALTGAVSDLTPNNGDTVTITAPAGVTFNAASSVVTIGGLATFLVSRSATEIKFVAPPAAGGTATVSNVGVDYAPGLSFAVPTASSFQVAGFPLLTASVVGLRAIGDSVTLTIPAPFKWGRGAGTSAVVSSGGSLSTPAVSADSSTVRFQIGPNATDTLRITGLRINGTTLGGYQLKAQAATTTPAVTNFAGVFSSATPAANDTVTLTAPGAFRFRPTATVTNGGLSPLIISRSADSTQIRFVPARATGSAPVIVSGIILTSLPSVPLTLPTAANFTSPAARAGTADIATAPTIALPAVGGNITFYDGGSFGGNHDVSGGVGNRFYKITVPANTSVTVNVSWNNTADIDILYGVSDGSDFLNCFAGATGSNPEQATCTLPTGDTILHINLFSGTAPGVFRISLTRNN